MILSCFTAGRRPFSPLASAFRSFSLAALLTASGWAGAGNGEASAALQWFESGRPRNVAWQAVDALQKAPDDGLDPDDYDTASLRSVLTALEGGTSLPDADLAALDGALSSAMQRFLADLHGGRISPRAIQANFPSTAADRFDAAAVLREALANGRVPDAVAGAVPANPFYTGLRRALIRYRAMADDPAVSRLWRAPLPTAPRKLEPGQSWSGVPALAARLAALGDMAPQASPSSRYDGAVVEGVKAFQVRHGIAPDGVLGQDTLARLEVPPAARVRQIGLNLERLRWTPLLQASRMIFVNVPEFVLRAYSVEGSTVTVRQQMKVIVGKALDTRTPLFAEDMRFIEFSPNWNVPPSIAQAELVPRLRREPGYFAAQGFEFVGGDGRVVGTLSDENLDAVMRGQLRIRQRPGPKNALGDIKFVFPNNDNIYLHHTPAPQLFARTRRDFSHGCIRVASPVELAKFVLKDQPEWTEQRIRDAMEKGSSATLRLREPLPVVIAYATALAKGDGKVYFFQDIYGQDAVLDAALRRAAGPAPRARAAGKTTGAGLRPGPRG